MKKRRKSQGISWTEVVIALLALGALAALFSLGADLRHLIQRF